MDAVQVDQRARRTVVAQWLGVLGPPVLWGMRFGLNYALMPRACLADDVLLLHSINAVALLMVLSLGLLAYRFWNGTRGAPPAGATDLVRRTRFMGLFGMMSAGLFTVVIIAEALANIAIDPCLRAGPLVPH